MRLAILAVFLITLPAFGATAFVQGNGTDDATSSTCAVTLTGTGTNSTLVYVIIVYNPVAAAVSIGDTVNSYTPLRTADLASTAGWWSGFAANPAGGNRTITGTISVSKEHKCFAWEFSGLTAPLSADGAGAFTPCTSSCTTAMTSAAAAITAGSLVIGYGGTGVAGLISCAQGTGYTMPAGTAGAMPSTGSWGLCGEYQLSSAGGSQSAAITTGVTTAKSMAIVAIKSTPSTGMVKREGAASWR